jgi:hypothetical protein
MLSAKQILRQYKEAMSKSRTEHPLLGRLFPDPVGICLGTNFERFYSPFEVDGLCKILEDGKRLDILAIASQDPGRGCCRRFFAAAKNHFDTICVWVILEPIVASMLMRYGFVPASEIMPDGEWVEGFKWVKPTL